MVCSEEDIAHLKKILPQLVQFYPFLNVNAEIEPVDAGFANLTFRLKGRYDLFLKSLIDINKIEQDKTEDIFQELSAASFPTCLPFRNSHGNFLTRMGNDNILLFPYIIIEEPLRTDKNLSKIGNLLARLHTSHFTPKLNRYTASISLGRFFEDYEILEKQGLSNSFSYINLIREISDNLPGGFCHSDLAYDNLLSTKDDVKGFIDFEESGIGPYLLDITEAIIQLCFEKNDFIHDIKIFLEGYKEKRSLNTDEIENFYNGLFLGCMLRNIFWVKQPDSEEKTRRIALRLNIAKKIEETGKDKITDIVQSIFS